MIALLTGRAGIWLAGAVLLLAVVASIYWMGGRDARREADELRDEITTDRRMDDAGEDLRSGDDQHIRDWLRRYGE